MFDFRQIDWDEACREEARRLTRLAIQEDLGRAYDWTTLALVPPDTPGRAEVVVRKPGVVAGLVAAAEVLGEFDPKIVWKPLRHDGDAVSADTIAARISGPARSLLAAERTMLNFLGRLSGIATLTRQYVDAVARTGARIYDTRKTTPGWRRLEKYAVRRGGGCNHRLSLCEAILIKDNHLAMAAQLVDEAASFFPHNNKAGSLVNGIGNAVQRARAFLAEMNAGPGPSPLELGEILIEIEVDSLAQFEVALAAEPDLIMLDNFSLADLRKAVELRNRRGSRIELEASGGVSLDTLRAIAETGVERISAGALTHSAPWLDLALDWS